MVRFVLTVSWRLLRHSPPRGDRQAELGSIGTSRPRTNGKYKKLCRSDPAATMAISSGALLHPSYKQHRAVDDHPGVVAVEVVRGEEQDIGRFPERIDALAATLEQSLGQITAQRHAEGLLPARRSESRALRRFPGGGARVARAVAISGPLPGTAIRRRATSVSLARRAISVSSLRSSASNCASAARIPDLRRCHQLRRVGAPGGTICPNSRKCPRRASMASVRCRRRRSRTRNTTATLCVASLFTGTKRIVGRKAASQIASASLVS